MEPANVTPDPEAPSMVEDLPDFWDARRLRHGKPDKSRCAAELRLAISDPVKPNPCRFAACEPCVQPSTECHGFCDMTAARNFVDALDDLSIERLVQAGLERGRVGPLEQRVRASLSRLDLRRGQGGRGL